MKKHINSKLISAFLSSFIVISSLSGMVSADETLTVSGETAGSVQEIVDRTGNADDESCNDDISYDSIRIDSESDIDNETEGYSDYESDRDNLHQGILHVEEEEDEENLDYEEKSNNSNIYLDDQSEDVFQIYYVEGKHVSADECSLFNPGYAVASGSSYYSRYNFTDIDNAAYRALKNKISDVAYGRSASTVFALSFADICMDGNFTAQDLGLSYIIANDSPNPQLPTALEKVMPHSKEIVYSLLVDCPFEFYWYDKTTGYSESNFSYKIRKVNGEWVVNFIGSISYSFVVSTDYVASASDRYSVSSTKVNKAKQAASNAQAIVNKYASLSDIEKLKSYKNEICNLVSYDDYVARDGANYGDPWQIIYVFDQNSNTNVVCEGYAKAFKYLCDLTDFSSNDIKCILAYGDFRGGTGAGLHMWNVVSLGNNTNYLVDVTNCDTGSVGYSDLLFMRNATTVNTRYSSYSFTCNNYTATYIYDVEASSILYRNSELDITTNALAKAPTMTMKRMETGVQLAWTPVVKAKKYEVCRKTETTDWQTIKETTDLTFTDPIPLSDTTPYTYGVRGVGSDGSYLNPLEDSASTQDLPAIQFSTQPVDYTGKIGDTATFVAIAEGNGITYQWQYMGSSGWVDSGATGAKTSSLSVKITSSTNGVKYRCVVKDSKNVTSSSNVVTLRVAETLSITTQPKDYNGAVGSTATFSVVAQGTGLTYQWQTLYNGSWTNISVTGSKTSKLSLEVTTARNGVKYRCVIKDSAGSTVATNAVAIKVITPLKITTQPKDYYGAVGSTATFSVAAQGTGLTYQWQTLYNGQWTNISVTGSKTSKLSLEVTTARNGVKYRCVIKDIAGSTVATNAVAINVITPLKITTQPKDYYGAVGSTATFSVAAQGTGLTYQWQTLYNGQWTNISVTGSKTSKLSLEATTARNGVKYRCVIKDTAGSTVATNAVAINVITLLKITTQPKNYYGAVGSTATFSVAAQGTGLTYQWQTLYNGQWTNISVTGSKTSKLSLEVTTARNGVKYRCVIKDIAGSTVATNAVAINVITPLKITSQPKDYSGRVGSTATFSVVAQGTGLTYQWQTLYNGQWTNISVTGSKTSKLSLEVTTARNGMQYRCVIKDIAGSTVATNAVRIRVTV